MRINEGERAHMAEKEGVDRCTHSVGRVSGFGAVTAVRANEDKRSQQHLSLLPVANLAVFPNYLNISLFYDIAHVFVF